VVDALSRWIDRSIDAPVGLYRWANIPLKGRRIRRPLTSEAFRRQKIPRGETTAKMLMGRRLPDAAAVAAFIADFDAVIADPEALSITDQIILDIDRSQVIDEVDREYWLDVLLRATLPTGTSRLPAAYGTGDDPLGITTGRLCIIIDGQSPNRRYIGASGNSNGVYTDEVRTIVSTSGGSGSNQGLLWDDANDLSYNYTVWGDIFSLNETGSANTRRFPKDGSPVTVYVRGGTYTHIRALDLSKNDAAAVAAGRIVIRNYPGELPIINMGSEKVGGVFRYDYMLAIKRARTYIATLDFVGNRYDAGEGGKVFAPLCLSFGAQASSSVLLGCKVREFRSLPAENGWDVSHPDHIDFGFTNRENFDPPTGNGSAGSAFGVNVASIDILIRRCIFQDAADGYPYVGGYPSGVANYFGGETVHIEADCPRVIECVFRGPAPHARIRMVKSRGLFEKNDIENTEHICMLLTEETGTMYAGHHTVRYNWLHTFGQLVPSDDTGGGAEVFNTYNSEFHGNVFWSPGGEVGDDITGLWIIGDDDYSTQAKGNRVHHNIFYKNNLFVGHAGGSTDPAYSRVVDTLVYNNILLGMDTPHQGNAIRNSPLHYFIRDQEVDYGNRFSTNLITRYEAGPMFTVHYHVPFNDYSENDIDDVLPGGGASTYTGNITADPALVCADPVGQNMTPINATALAWFTDPNIPFRRTDLYHAEDPLREIFGLAALQPGPAAGGSLSRVGIKTGGQL